VQLPQRAIQLPSKYKQRGEELIAYTVWR
jgi:hypothetical protein